MLCKFSVLTGENVTRSVRRINNCWNIYEGAILASYIDRLKNSGFKVTLVGDKFETRMSVHILLQIPYGKLNFMLKSILGSNRVWRPHMMKPTWLEWIQYNWMAAVDIQFLDRLAKTVRCFPLCVIRTQFSIAGFNINNTVKTIIVSDIFVVRF